MSGVRITEYKGPTPTENPERCPVCRAKWDFATNGYGVLRQQHPVTRCVPVKEYVVEVSQESELYETKCDECGLWFVPKKFASGSQTMCGPVCREKRRDRQKLESYTRSKLLIKRVA